MFLALDIETGGIGHDKSLLSLFMAFLGENCEVRSELDLKIKPDNGIYHVTAEAMAINKIDLIEHDKTAITYREAGTKVYDFLNAASRLTTTQLIPLGHGVSFDCAFIKNTIISEGSWNKFVSYRSLDTSPISRFLMLTGKLPKLSGSLESLTKHFGIKPVGPFHEAKTDVMASIEVFKRLLELNRPEEIDSSDAVANAAPWSDDKWFKEWEKSEKDRQAMFRENRALKVALKIRAHKFQCPDCNHDLTDCGDPEEHDEDCPHFKTEQLPL